MWPWSKTAGLTRSARLDALRHPWMTARITLGIYWQALHLWRKKCPPPHPYAAKTGMPSSHGEETRAHSNHLESFSAIWCGVS